MSDSTDKQMSEIRTYVVDGEPVTIETGSGNVFADLGLPDPEERLQQAQARMAQEAAQSRTEQAL